MSTYTKIIYHIVFSTKNREATLVANKRDDLYRYIWGVLKNKKCHLYRIGGIEDHLHILTSLHSTIPLAGLVKDIKLSSSSMIKETCLFPGFTGWQKGYGAFTHSDKELPYLIEYIKKQKEHHHKTTFEDEYRNLLNEAAIEFDEKYFLD